MNVLGLLSSLKAGESSPDVKKNIHSGSPVEIFLKLSKTLNWHILDLFLRSEEVCVCTGIHLNARVFQQSFDL